MSSRNQYKELVKRKDQKIRELKKKIDLLKESKQRKQADIQSRLQMLATLEQAKNIRKLKTRLIIAYTIGIILILIIILA
ncbi:MAG: hypothetical protein ACE5ES_05600 [Candidatus Nanoarchaeia archaeon]